MLDRAGCKRWKEGWKVFGVRKSKHNAAQTKLIQRRETVRGLFSWEPRRWRAGWDLKGWPNGKMLVASWKRQVGVLHCGWRAAVMPSDMQLLRMTHSCWAPISNSPRQKRPLSYQSSQHLNSRAKEKQFALKHITTGSDMHWNSGEKRFDFEHDVWPCIVSVSTAEAHASLCAGDLQRENPQKMLWALPAYTKCPIKVSCYYLISFNCIISTYPNFLSLHSRLYLNTILQKSKLRFRAPKSCLTERLNFSIRLPSTCSIFWSPLNVMISAAPSQMPFWSNWCVYLFIPPANIYWGPTVCRVWSVREFPTPSPLDSWAPREEISEWEGNSPHGLPILCHVIAGY